MNNKRELSIIVAVDRNLAIGKGNIIPWKLKTDIARFKEITDDSVVIMGRKTYESLPTKYRPLPNRINIVISRTFKSDIMEDVIVCRSLNEAIKKAYVFQKNVFIIGGASVYKQALSRVDKIYLSEINTEIDGADSFFPVVDWNVWNVETSEYFAKSEKDEFDYVFKVLIKKTFTVLDNAREASQFEAMTRINNRSECPFCVENFFKEHKNPVILDDKHWIVTKNQWPYNGTNYHILLIPKQHREKISDITHEEFCALENIICEIEKKLDIESGSLCMRFGNPKFNGGTVNHIHIHIIVPKKPGDEGFVDIKFRVSAKKK